MATDLDNGLPAAEQIFDWLYVRTEPLQPADLIMGFGLFDAKIPRRCGREITSVILVANAYRQRRVDLTARRHMEGVAFQNAPPVTDCESERLMFREKGQDIDELMLGEFDRMRAYPERGYIVANEIPPEIELVEKRLRESSR